MSLRRAARPSPAGGCRMCTVSCERVVYPSGCIASGCSRSYSYAEGGRMFFGCLEQVFSVEIDRAAFDAMEATAAGFGGLRVNRDPLPVCRTGIDRTFAHRAETPCVNPAFQLSSSDGAHSVEVR